MNNKKITSIALSILLLTSSITIFGAFIFFPVQEAEAQAIQLKVSGAEFPQWENHFYGPQIQQIVIDHPTATDPDESTIGLQVRGENVPKVHLSDGLWYHYVAEEDFFSIYLDISTDGVRDNNIAIQDPKPELKVRNIGAERFTISGNNEDKAGKPVSTSWIREITSTPAGLFFEVSQNILFPTMALPFFETSSVVLNGDLELNGKANNNNEGQIQLPNGNTVSTATDEDANKFNQIVLADKNKAIDDKNAKAKENARAANPDSDQTDNIDEAEVAAAQVGNEPNLTVADLSEEERLRRGATMTTNQTSEVVTKGSTLGNIGDDKCNSAEFDKPNTDCDWPYIRTVPLNQREQLGIRAGSESVTLTFNELPDAISTSLNRASYPVGSEIMYKFNDFQWNINPEEVDQVWMVLDPDSGRTVKVMNSPRGSINLQDVLPIYPDLDFDERQILELDE